jgi:UPF0755 protein
VLIVFLSFIYYLNQTVVTPKVIYIPKGSINQIIAYLHSKNYDVSKLDALLLRFIGSPQSGWINLESNQNLRLDFLYKLTKAKAALQTITLIPGETTYLFFEQLAQKLGLNQEKLQKEFQKASTIKEGALVPDTYKIPKGIDEAELINLLLKNSQKRMQALSKKFFGTYNEQKWKKILVIASIIQKESANNEEMPIVSSVIYNRLKKGMPLQMDGTLNYGKYSHIRVTPKRIRQDKTTYNTYTHKGLPKNPVCNVSFEAIKAAIFPTKSNYLYFMKNRNGVHDFTCNYSTHLRNIRRATK